MADLLGMKLFRIIPDRVPIPLARTLVAFGFLIAFFAAAAVIHPGSSTARPTQIPEYPLESTGAEEVQLDPKSLSLGTLESRQFRVEILGGTEELRYNVYDALGNPIAQNVTEEQLYRIDPLLDISNMTGEQAPALMMLENDLDF